LPGQYFDQISLLSLFLMTVTGLILFIEFGYQLVIRRQGKKYKEQVAQVRAIMGATLGLLAFMLAFTFSAAQSHFEARVEAMVADARTVNHAFLSATDLNEPIRSEVRKTLRDYMRLRLDMDLKIKSGDSQAVPDLLNQAEANQLRLWRIAEQHDAAAFQSAVIAIMDVHIQRIQAALANRIPYIIWLTLYTTGALAMLVMGYQAGLVGKRTPVATISLAVAFAAVMMLIADLDRPFMSLFELNNSVLAEQVERMERVLKDEHN
jgi:nitrate/nitrite transporter NarK